MFNLLGCVCINLLVGGAELAFGITATIDNANLGCTVSIKLLTLDEVEVDGKRPCDEEAGEGNSHGDSRIAEIGDSSKNWGEDGST